MCVCVDDVYGIGSLGRGMTCEESSVTSFHSRRFQKIILTQEKRDMKEDQGVNICTVVR